MRKLASYLCFAASFCIVIGLAGAAVAAPDRLSMQLSQALMTLERNLAADPWAPVVLPHGLEAGPGADDVAELQQMTLLRPSSTDGDSPSTLGLDFQDLDMRLPLAMLSQSHGAGDIFDVVTAQGDASPKALVLRKGRAGLSELIQAARSANAGAVDARGVLVLTRPVVIWDNAELILSPGHHLEFDREAGAFMLVLGLLETTGATISGTGGPNVHAPDFKPFITAANGGRLILRKSTFSHLGFGRTSKFAGISIARNGLHMSRGTSEISGNLFDTIGSVWIDTDQDVRVVGNRFRNPQRVALSIVNAGRPVLTDNVFFQGGAFNAIQVVRGSYDARIERNLILGGERAGIVLKFDSQRARIEDNVIWRRRGAGIIFAKAHCGTIAGNWVVENRQKGIEVRSARGVQVVGNRITMNRSAGLWVSAQDNGVNVLVKDNLFAQNRAGLTTATGADLVLENNDFTRQLPKYLSGDISPQNAIFAHKMEPRPMVLSAGGLTFDAIPQTGCKPRQGGS
ncbi:right-handed parallel beta-helix repeat-containing protein [Pseudaestuariivita sp.]|uniref:right-handed parallel beta-helix repeat-containing protein n=1 Tax=Pseudaestuariivita sp. TaxID=2211669 RepID=UPI0040582D54